MTNFPVDRTPAGRIGRLDRWVRANPLVILAVLGLFLLTTTLSLVQFGEEGWRWWDTRHNWRQHEYETLASLHSDFTLERFDEALGAPLFRRLARDGRWLELAYRRRDYWVQVVARQGSITNSADYFSVTSCSENFRPTFRLPSGPSITLNQSTLASVKPKFGQNYRYLVPASVGATLMEYEIGPHTWNFKSYAWGWNGVCYDSGLPLPDVLAFVRAPGMSRGSGYAIGSVSELPKAVLRARRTVVLNTFAEWGPTIQKGWPGSIWLGVNEGFVQADRR